MEDKGGGGGGGGGRGRSEIMVITTCVLTAIVEDFHDAPVSTKAYALLPTVYHVQHNDVAAFGTFGFVSIDDTKSELYRSSRCTGRNDNLMRCVVEPATCVNGTASTTL